MTSVATPIITPTHYHLHLFEFSAYSRFSANKLTAHSNPLPVFNALTGNAWEGNTYLSPNSSLSTFVASAIHSFLNA